MGSSMECCHHNGLLWCCHWTEAAGGRNEQHAWLVVGHTFVIHLKVTCVGWPHMRWMFALNYIISILLELWSQEYMISILLELWSQFTMKHRPTLFCHFLTQATAGSCKLTNAKELCVRQDSQTPHRISQDDLSVMLDLHQTLLTQNNCISSVYPPA